MTWPLSRFQTYSRRTIVVPSNLNDLQDGVVRFINGTWGVKQLTIDGDGNHGTINDAGQLVLRQRANADTPLAVFKDAAGNSHGAIDHTGYLIGGYVEFKEFWDYLAFSPYSTGAVVLYGSRSSKWQSTVSSSLIRFNTQSATGVYANYASVSMENAPGNAIYQLFTPCQLVDLHAGLYCVLDFDLKIQGTTAAADYEFSFGLSSAQNSYTFSNVMMVQKTAGVNNWTGIVSTSSQSTVDLNVDATDGNWHHFRLEIFGSGTNPYHQSLVRFFVDGTYRGFINTTIPSGTFGLACQTRCVTANGSTDNIFSLGPVVMRYSRRSSEPVI